MLEQPTSEPREPQSFPVPQSLKELLATRMDWTARYGLFVAAFTAACTVTGVALSPYLLASHPLALVLLSPIPRHMMLAAPSLSLSTYLWAGVARRVLATSGALCLGLRFGEAGIAWAEQHDDTLRRGAQFLRWGFRRAGLLVVFISPNPFVVATAVAMGASVRLVLAISSAGHVAWLLLWYQFGDLASEWIAPVTAFFQRYTWQSTALCVLAVALYYARRLLRGSAH